MWISLGNEMILSVENVRQEASNEERRKMKIGITKCGNTLILWSMRAVITMR